jgi:hypothetical protein
LDICPLLITQLFDSAYSKGIHEKQIHRRRSPLLYDLMQYLEENDLDGLLLLVDFEKAFDSIEWEIKS